MKMRKTVSINTLMYGPLLAFVVLAVYQAVSAEWPINAWVLGLTLAVVAVLAHQQMAASKHYIWIKDNILSLREGNHRLDIDFDAITDIDYSNHTLVVHGEGLEYKFRVARYKPVIVMQVVNEVLRKIDRN